ncbi:MAG: MBL fold metallo-hydrolase [Clostridia bacterium]|nr:MBL fold metallo-hydrolase [Clostridia bacterium]
MKRLGGGKQVLGIAVHVLAFLLAALLLWHMFSSFAPVVPSEEHLYVYVLDVGQSDAVLLRSGTHTLLIDTGTATEERALRRALARYGIEHIDYLVLTHPHEDHVGNARYIVENLSVGTVLLPSVGSEDYAYSLFLAAVAQSASVLTATAGQHFALGNAKVEVLSAGTATSDKDGDVNDASVVLRVCFGTQVFLFMGDAEAATESALISAYGSEKLDCDFLKVGHHGSSTSTSVPFLLATTPTVAAISCGKQNAYGFPHAPTLENLAAVGAYVYRTDESGTLVFGTNGQEIRLIPPKMKGLSL